jgi:hypothetical protein
MFTVDENRFNNLREHFYTWQRHGMPNCDRGLVSILCGINRIPGLVTILSCASHYLEDPCLDSAYVVIAVKEGHLESLFKLFEAVRSDPLLGSPAVTVKGVDVKLSVRRRPFPFYWEEDSRPYDGWTLELGIIVTQEVKDTALGVLQHRVKEFVEQARE